MKFFKYISLFLFTISCGGGEEDSSKTEKTKEEVAVLTKTSNAPRQAQDEKPSSSQNNENEEEDASQEAIAEQADEVQPPPPVSFEFEVVSENGGKLLVIQQKVNQASVLLIMDQNYSFDLVNRLVDISINGADASKARVRKIISNPFSLKNKICAAKDDEAKRYALTHFGLTTGTIARVSSVLGENLVESFLSDPINGGDFDGYEVTSMTSGKDGMAGAVTLSKKGMYEDIIMTKPANTPIHPLDISIADYLSILENTLRQISENEVEYCAGLNSNLLPFEVNALGDISESNDGGQNDGVL